ncbi:hypothetical protein AVEN_209575-1 [Araneus ventricosus]|uniref:Helitron helicase-like domain-containing protein n=1 Tax=Araneus ventricosus TaxID=182803 RepID=A0A4Y2RN73_ARAVE|nr:hypothetical protein AVEN_209575-1 [Araneus ventricosus]
MNQAGEKWSVRFSLWIGNNRTLERTLALSVPANSSFYRIMEFAAGVDNRFNHIQSVNGQAPQYAQLYVIDSTQATEIRVNHPANEQCNIRIMDQIDRFFRQHNQLSDTYRMLREVESLVIAEPNEAGDDVPVVNMVFRRDRHSDQRRYNAPTTNEIAMVFVNSDVEPPFERDIRVYPLNPENPEQPFININILSPNLDPMAYPILFPYGEPGWQPNWRCESYQGAQGNQSRVNVTMLQYKSALTAVRDDFNPIISAGKLTQQWIVDSYLLVEANNLNFIRTHQQQLRTKLYQGLANHLENAARNAVVKSGIAVQKRVAFKDGHEEEALEAARSRQTMLESWFQLNQSDTDAQTLLYTDIPYNYVYDRKNWKKAKERR